MERILRNKSGVSLIVVLLFMMIATIAATATYKWITSEGRSSTSRMLEREAYQSAIAGIDNARAWMTWHANDVGAVVKQYIDDGKPVNLTKQLRTLQRAGQNYQVWLVGANTENTTYKLKILSEGEARDGLAKHSEVAILNVDGLYQVKVPSDKNADLNFTEAFFGGANSGISMEVSSAIINGNSMLNSTANADEKLIVAGDLNVNSNTNIKDLYVEGNLYSCTDFDSRGDVYVKEKLYVNGTMKISGSLYAAGGVDFSGLGGDGKNQCETGSGGGFQVDGNMTSNGDVVMPRHTSGTKYVVNGNVVLNGSSQLDFPRLSEFGYQAIPYVVKFFGNVYLGGINDGWHIGYGVAENIVLGSEGKKVYSKTPLYRITDANNKVTNYPHWTGWGRYVYTQAGDTLLHFQGSNGKAQTSTLGIAKNVFCNSQYCAPTNDFSDAYFWANAYFYWPNWSGGVQGVGSPLADAYGNSCANGEKWWDGWYWIDWLNCDVVGGGTSAATTSSSQSYLYDKGYIFRNEVFLQVNGDYTNSAPDTAGWGANRMQDYADRISSESDGNCKGAHVKDPIQFNSDLLNDTLLHTSSNKMACSSVNGLFDSWKGWGANVNQCYGLAKDADELYDDQWLLIEFDGGNYELANPGSGSISSNIILIVNDSATVNLPPTTETAKVIIYFKKGGSVQINNSATYRNYFIFSNGDLGYNNGGGKLTGSIFLTNCHDIKSANIVSAKYNSELTEALAGSGILCNVGESCSTASGTSSSSSSKKGDFDSYYISMAPQLGISLESQYKNREKFSNSTATDVSGSYIVLPRIIYLPADPVGKLSDYYNVLGLNGAKVTKNDVSVSSCKRTKGNATLRVAGSLYSNGDTLKSGNYECTANNSDYGSVPFWVVIGSKSDSTPSTYFAEETIPIGVKDSRDIVLVVPAHSTSIKIHLTRTDLQDFGEQWTAAPQNGVTCSDNTSCTLDLAASTERQEITVFRVTTNGPSSGSFRVSLNSGEGYNIGSPWMSEVILSNTFTLERTDVLPTDKQIYCAANSGDCPDDLSEDWPSGSCGSSEWVRVSGASCKLLDPNKSWKCIGGGSGTLKFTKGSAESGCVVIIPDASLEVGSLEENGTYSLRAGVFAKPLTLVVGFTGDVGGKNPTILVRRNSGDYSACAYDDLSSNKKCKITVFHGDFVTALLEPSTSDDNDNFSYWKCANAGGYCPDNDVLSSDTFPQFTVQGSSDYELIAHFGESDKHCFFDEFNHSELVCSVSNSQKEYCLDNCNSGSDGVCKSVSAGPTYTNAKWHLLGGSLSDILYENGRVSLKREGRSRSTNVKVLSTVTAGLYGTLKAFVQVSKEASGMDSKSSALRNTGLLLRSNATATDALVLNAYANASGNLEVQLCAGDNCKNAVVRDKNGNSVSASSGTAVMVEAVLGKSESGDQLAVNAYVGNYYGSMTAYSATFDLSTSLYQKYATRSYEYVGFALADANFKILGIGWKSDDYASECHDTYPTVKCSFSAVAEDGIIPTEKDVRPWVGHSAWFSSKSCRTTYTYANGSDACGGYSNSETTCSHAYNFSASGAGLHGYQNDGSDVKTAYASLDCDAADGETNAWASTAQKAHCGQFWTGKFTECTANENLSSAVTSVGSSEERCEIFDSKKNLRSAKLNVKVESASYSLSDNVALEVYLVSKNSSWSSDEFESRAVSVSRTGTSSFDVVDAMAANAEGFDPENVSKICYRNSGSSVTVSASTDCENTVSLKSCRATYTSGSLWNIEADVSDADKTSLISQFTVKRRIDGGDEQTQTYSCVAGSTNSCPFSDATANLSFDNKKNPYAEDQGKNYTFSVSLVGSDGSVSSEKECTVDPSTIGSVTASCKIDGNSTVKPGAGLPIFQFTLSGCPAVGGCPYMVYLDGGVLTSGSGATFSSNFGNGTRSYNTATSPLSAGTYTYKVAASGTSEYPFKECTAEFTVANSSSSSSEEFSSSSEQPTRSSSSSVGTSSSSAASVTADCYFKKDAAVGATAKFYVSNLEGTGSNTVSMHLEGEGVSKDVDVNKWIGGIEFTAPKDLGSYTYTLSYNGSAVCSATLKTVNILECSASSSEISLGDSFTLNTAYAGTCWYATLQENGNYLSWSCNTSQTVKPTSSGTFTYTYTVGSGDIGTASCTVNVVVK